MILIREKIEQAIEILKEKKIDCWITFVRESGISRDPMLDFLIERDVSWHSAFIITSKGKAIAIIGQGDAANIKDLNVYNEVHSYIEGIKEVFQKVMSEINPAKIALNYSTDSEICDGLTHGMYQVIFRMLKEINLENAITSSENIISSLRGRKSDTEICYLKEAIRHTLEIFDKVTPFIRPGVTEKEIANFMLNEVAERGLEVSWDEQYCPGVFTGPDTNIAHYSPTDRKVERGHILNMDFGVKINGYCSDLQRTWYVLKEDETEAPFDVRKGFETIKTSIELSKQAMQPGMKGYEIDKIARDYIISQGYDEFQHGLGTSGWKICPRWLCFTRASLGKICK